MLDDDDDYTRDDYIRDCIIAEEADGPLSLEAQVRKEMYERGRNPLRRATPDEIAKREARDRFWSKVFCASLAVTVGYFVLGCTFGSEVVPTDPALPLIAITVVIGIIAFY